ncbi:MAG: SpaH/EbpB family LPXTG-anchored major pilin [Enterococcus sp.]
MKKRSKLWGVLATTLMTLPLLGGVLAAGTAQATEVAEVETTSITVNKRVWDEGQMPDNILNSGEEMSNFGGEPLAGAGFTLYDASARYYELVDGGSTPAEAVATIQTEAESGLPAGATNLGVEQETAADGHTTFANLPLKNAAGKDAVYLILETSTPTTPTITKKAVPMVVTMPVYKVEIDGEGNPVLVDGKIQYTDELNTNIQLYPKNETAEATKEFTNIDDFETNVTIAGEEYKNVTTGDVFEYQLNVPIPANIADPTQVSSFVITDMPDEGLEYQAETVAIPGLEATDYSVTEQAGGFTITLDVASNAVKALAGQTLIITYDMKLTAEVVPDTGLKNSASVTVNNESTTEITPPTGVTTSGKKFVKTDAHTGDELAGAKFVVQNAAGEYATFTRSSTNEYVFESWVTEQASATEVESAATATVGGPGVGEIWIKGFVNGDYKLIETQAPSDEYVKLSEAIEFTITNPGYSTEELTNVTNTPKGLLPSTGGNGIYAFLAIGLALMTGAVIWYKRSKEDVAV